MHVFLVMYKVTSVWIIYYYFNILKFTERCKNESFDNLREIV